LAGTVAMFALPVFGEALGLSDRHFATWVGSSVHDVAQVVAAGATRGSEVLALAVVVKLTRVVLLAPVVAGVSAAAARSSKDAGSHPRSRSTALLPAFVAAFLLAMLVRSTGLVPTLVVETAGAVSGFLLTAALVGLGSGVRVDRLRAIGGPALLLGTLAWLIVAGVSLLGTLVLV
jgi:uncharacterized integral membrane protein (TIGR00698 family)